MIAGLVSRAPFVSRRISCWEIHAVAMGRSGILVGQHTELQLHAVARVEGEGLGEQQ